MRDFKLKSTLQWDSLSSYLQDGLFRLSHARHNINIGEFWKYNIIQNRYATVEQWTVKQFLLNYISTYWYKYYYYYYVMHEENWTTKFSLCTCNYVLLYNYLAMYLTTTKKSEKLVALLSGYLVVVGVGMRIQDYRRV